MYSVTHFCLTVCDPTDSSPPGSSVHGTYQQEYWSGLPVPISGNLSDLGIESVSLGPPPLKSPWAEEPGRLQSMGLQRVGLPLIGGFFTTEPPGEP